MMNKLIVLVLAFAIVAPALADDLIPAPWANDGYDNRVPGLPGSTYSEWTYDDPCGLFYFDPADNSWFVSHPLKEDPYIDPCSGAFSHQYWGSDADPCAPDWADALPGGVRQGGLVFAYGSWDMNNFVHDQPAKDLWVQITYLGDPIEPGDPCLDTFGPGAGSWIEDPCTPEEEWGWWEGLTDPCDPCSFGYHEGPMSEWPSWAPPPLETWMSGGGYEIWSDAELVNRQVLGDGWTHDVWAMTLEINPEFEWFEFGAWDGPAILIDQIVIETLCYVPEPATMVLLGLGSLMMIRRKKS